VFGEKENGKAGERKRAENEGNKGAGRREFGSDIDVEGSTYKFTGKS
jgi:hypothetical protein